MSCMTLIYDILVYLEVSITGGLNTGYASSNSTSIFGVREELVLRARPYCCVSRMFFGDSLFFFNFESPTDPFISIEFFGVCLGEELGDGFGVAFVLNGLNVKSPLKGRGLFGIVPRTVVLTGLDGVVGASMLIMVG